MFGGFIYQRLRVGGDNLIEQKKSKRKKKQAGILILVLIILNGTVLVIPNNVSAGEPQPSVENNILYLHYDANNNKYWMNADPGDSVTNSWSMTLGSSAYIRMTFSLEPKDTSKYLIMDASQDWKIRIHFETQGIKPELQEVRGTINVGEHTATTNMPTTEGDYYVFNLPGGYEVINPAWDIIFEFYFETTTLSMADYTVYFDGTSTITLPITDVDIDSDGDNIVDSRDPDSSSYDGDEKDDDEPETVIPGFEAIFLIIGIIITIVILIGWQSQKN